MVAVQYLVHDPRSSHRANELSTLSGVHFFFAILLGAAAQARVGSSYALSLYSISLTVAMFYHRTKLQQRTRATIGVDLKTN